MAQHDPMMPKVGDLVRLQYGNGDLPFLAVVTGVEQRAGYEYVTWTRQLVWPEDTALGDPGSWGFAGKFGAFRYHEPDSSHVRILHP